VGSSTPISPVGPGSIVPGVERPSNKGRRLYETGLDQHLHEQQFSAMNRIDTLTRQCALGAQTPPLGRNSPTGLSHPAERWNGAQISGKASMPNMRTASPSPTVPGVGAFDFPPRQAIPGPKSGFGMPPLSPPMSEHDDHPVLKLQPNDRGKATALGAFSNPPSRMTRTSIRKDKSRCSRVGRHHHSARIRLLERLPHGSRRVVPIPTQMLHTHPPGQGPTRRRKGISFPPTASLRPAQYQRLVPLQSLQQVLHGRQQMATCLVIWSK
jgi:hypothetical protein